MPPSKRKPEDDPAGENEAPPGKVAKGKAKAKAKGNKAKKGDD